MSENPARLGPLDGLADTRVAGMEERPFCGLINLRGDIVEADFTAAVQRVTGMQPPRQPNTVARAGELQLAWLGPDEWLLIAPPGAEGALCAALDEALAGLHAGATDLSEGHTVIVLEAADAEAILACECPLDLHPHAFPPGACAQTLLGKSNVLILREEAQRFALVVRRSFAGYLYTLLGHLVRQTRALAALDPESAR